MPLDLIGFIPYLFFYIERFTLSHVNIFSQDSFSLNQSSNEIFQFNSTTIIFFFCLFPQFVCYISIKFINSSILGTNIVECFFYLCLCNFVLFVYASFLKLFQKTLVTGHDFMCEKYQYLKFINQYFQDKILSFHLYNVRQFYLFPMGLSTRIFFQ